jgi:hypothetical protein
MHSLEYAISESAAGEGYQQGSHHERPIHRSYLRGQTISMHFRWLFRPVSRANRFFIPLLLGYHCYLATWHWIGRTFIAGVQSRIVCNAPFSDAFHSFVIPFKRTYPSVVPPNKVASREARSGVPPFIFLRRIDGLWPNRAFLRRIATASLVAATTRRHLSRRRLPGTAGLSKRFTLSRRGRAGVVRVSRAMRLRASRSRSRRYWRR